jgi:epimerase EvaD
MSTMKSRPLAVTGAVEFTPQVFHDVRGHFFSPYQESAFVEALGFPLFPVAQTNHSMSRRDVVRGLHYTATPPGCAKYVYCARGRTLDVVVDCRTGSPTFGGWDAVLLDQESFRAVYLPIGVAHGFIALEDDTVVSYLLSGTYEPQHELALAFLDPELGLPVPSHIEPVRSARDLVAPTLAQAAADGLLPEFAECRELERGFAQRVS